jgi:cell division protein FtsL
VTKVNLLLLVVLIGSALALVRSSYESRRLFAAIERAAADERRLDTEHKRLVADAQAQATHARVERVARERLRMRAAGPGLVHYVADPAEESPR